MSYTIIIREYANGSVSSVSVTVSGTISGDSATATVDWEYDLVTTNEDGTTTTEHKTAHKRGDCKLKDKMTGKIIKGISGFYYVYVEGAGLYECKAKGAFRKQKIKPLVGDNVEIAVIDEANKLGNVEKILPRKTELIRPAVSNIDMALVILHLQSRIQILICLIGFVYDGISESPSDDML